MRKIKQLLIGAALLAVVLVSWKYILLYPRTCSGDFQTSDGGELWLPSEAVVRKLGRKELDFGIFEVETEHGTWMLYLTAHPDKTSYRNATKTVFKLWGRFPVRKVETTDGFEILVRGKFSSYGSFLHIVYDDVKFEPALECLVVKSRFN